MPVLVFTCPNTAHPHRDGRQNPLRGMEENLADRLPALRAGA
jgi:hypothetical protein